MVDKSQFKYVPVIEQAKRDMKFHYVIDQGEGKLPTYGIKAKCEMITDIERLKEFAKTCEGKRVAVDTETTGLSYKNDYIVGFSISTDAYSGVYVPIRHKIRIATKEQTTKRDEDGNIMYTKAGKERTCTVTTYTYSEQPKNVDAKEALDILYEIMKNSPQVLMYNAEFDLNMIKKEGYNVRKLKSFDVMILPYVFDPENKKKGLKETTKIVLGRWVPKFKDVTGAEEGEFQFIDPEAGYEYACYDTMGTFGIYEKLKDRVLDLLNKCPKKLKIDGKPYNLIKSDNRLIKAFVDYYGHTDMLIDNEVAKEYKKKIIKDLAEVSARVYPYFGKGQFSLSPSSNEFKRNMEEAQIVTGAFTDTGAISYGKKGIKEFNKNLRYLKEILNNFSEIDFSMGRLDIRKNLMSKILANIIKTYHEPYFTISETVNTLRVKAKDGSKIASDEFQLTLQHMLEKETEKLNVLKDIQTISSLNKALNSYIEKLTNVSSCKMRYKLMGTSSCRLASGNSSAKKEKNDYYIGLNAQNLTKPHACVWRAQQDFGKDHIRGWTFEYVDNDFYSRHKEDGEYYFVEGAQPEENIRKCVIAPVGRTIASLDYSGQEVRTIALQSGDRQMIDVLYESDHPELYPDAVDIHTATAYKIWGKENYTKDLRKRAKACVFATNYGGNEFTIAQNLDIPVDEAKEILDGFEKVYSRMFQWKKEEIDKMYKNKGIVFTPFGRPRQFITRLTTAHNLDDKSVSDRVLRSVERRVASHQVQGCLQGHVRILTDKGYIPIKELYDLDERGELQGNYKVHTGTHWADFKVISRGQANKSKLFLKGGYALDCDNRHELFCHTASRKENNPALVKKVTDLNNRKQAICTFKTQEIDFPAVLPETWTSVPKTSNAKVVTINKDVHTDLWYWVGYFMGDGSWCGHSSQYKDYYQRGISYTFGLHEEHTNVKRCVEFFQSLGVNVNVFKQLHKKGSNGRSMSARIYSAGIADYFNEVLGIPCGCHFDTKRVPEILFRSPVEHRKAFIDGLMDSDGYKKAGKIHMKNYELLYQVKQLCDISGIPCRINSPERRKCKTTCLTLGGKYGGLTQKDECTRRKSGRDFRYGARMFDHLEVSEELVDTYTLMVDDEEHRFVSDGIISKNCCGDILRIVLLKLYDRYFKSRDPHIDFLSTIHDEINFTIDDDVLIDYVREIEEIMRFDALKGKIDIHAGIALGRTFGSCFEFNWTDKTKTELVPERL